MFRFDKRTLYIILGLLIIMNLRTFTASSLLSLLLCLPAVIIAITFHEFAHAWAADKLGDDTPRYQGRLNLNPMSHIDPVGFVLLMFAGFGWGRPVQINPINFNRNVSMQKGEAIVSVAGPLMNFILAIVSAIILGVVYMFATPTFLLSSTGNIIYILLQQLVITNIGLGVFNLIPLPPLDGSKIFMSVLPYKARTWIINHSHIFYYVFLFIWISGLAGVIIAPIISLLYNGLMGGILALLRLF